MRRANILRLALALGLATIVTSASAYKTNDNWCDRSELGINYNDTSFTSRGMDQAIVNQHLRTAASWWSDAQATLRWSYNTTTTSTSNGDPGPVYGACQSEVPEFVSCGGCWGWAYWDYFWHPSCDFFGVNMDAWRVVMRTDFNGTCPFIGGWAWNIADVRANKRPLFLGIAQELGHAFGLDHDNIDPDAIMVGAQSTRALLTYDDVSGVRVGLGEGVDAKPLKTVRATPNTSGVLSFGTVAELRYNGVNRPSISGNGLYMTDPGRTAWDYAIAWVDQNDRINVTTANDDGSGNLVLNSVYTWGVYTRGAVNIAVGDGNRIGVAWTGTDPSRSINVAFSTDGGASFTQKTFSTAFLSSMGAVGISYSWNVNKWVLTWIEQAATSGARHKIYTTVSTDSTGSTWPSVVGYNDTLTMPNLTPAVTCMRRSANRCLMVYRTFAINDLRTIRQQAFEIRNAGSYDWMPTLTTSVETGNYGYSELSITRMEGNVAGYLYTYVWPTIANDKLTYRIKTSDETAAFDKPLQTWTGAVSRSGFAAAHNYRTGFVRLLWKEN